MIECTGRVVMPDRTLWESRLTAQSRVALHCLLHRMRAETFATGILKISGGRRTNLILIVDEQPKSCGASAAVATTRPHAKPAAPGPRMSCLGEPAIILTAITGRWRYLSRVSEKESHR